MIRAGHRYAPSKRSRERAVAFRGRPSNETPLSPTHCCLVVVDMQNHFVAPGGMGEVPPARRIVPTINALARRLRDAGVIVAWIQTTATGSEDRWHGHHTNVLAPVRAERRLASLHESAEGFALYPQLDVRRGDLRLTKIKYSAFAPHSSSLDGMLRRRGIDTVLIAGTATNVCCESTARDASMRNYRTIMVSDANATWTRKEHAATLDLFRVFFGEVMTSRTVLERLRPSLRAAGPGVE